MYPPRMTYLRVSSVELVEDGQPPIVRCFVLDAGGVRHEFVDKLPIVSKAATLPAHDAAIACAVVAVARDAVGRRLVTVDTSCPWGLETVQGLTTLSVLEQQLAPSDEVWISLNGARTPAARFGTNDGLNYGRHVDNGLCYQAVLPLARLAWYAPAFAQLVDEMREDDERHGDPTPLADCQYRRTLAEAAAFPDALAAALGIFSHRELLAHHLPFHEATSEYVINSTDAILVVAEQILIRGRCWHRRRGTSAASEQA